MAPFARGTPGQNGGSLASLWSSSKPGSCTLPSTMTPKPQRPKRQDNVLSSLNVAIEALNLTKEILSITPAKAVCGSVSVILTTIRVRFLPVPV